MKYRLEAVWPSPPESVREEVASFWLAESALPDGEDAQERARQLLVVARDPSGRVAGVSTALPIHVDRLGFKCFFYRTFVGQTHRTTGLHSTGLVQQILAESRRLLNERFQAGYDSGVLGIYIEVENPTVMRVRNEVIWQDLGANIVYIGKRRDGRHLRVWYFDGARIP